MADTTQQTKTAAPKPYDPMQEVQKKVVSQLGEFRASQAIEAAQAGKTDEEIISTLMQLAGTTYQKPTGDTAGFMGPLFGYKPGEAITKPEQYGLAGAKIIQDELRQSKKDPLEMKKLEGDVSQQPLQTQKLQTDVATGKQTLRQNDPSFRINMKVREKAA